MKKVNWKKWIVLGILILGVCILKYPYVLADENSELFIKRIFVIWGKEQYVNLIWFLTFFIIFFYSTNELCSRLEHFEMRFKNRKRYIIYLLKSSILQFLIVNFVVIFLQVLILSMIAKMKITMIPWMFFMHYVVEMLVSMLTIIVLYLLTKNYIVAYIIFIGVILLSLIITNGVPFIPVISLFSKQKFNFVSVIFIVVNIYVIYKIYLHYNIGGMKYEVRD